MIRLINGIVSLFYSTDANNFKGFLQNTDAYLTNIHVCDTSSIHSGQKPLYIEANRPMPTSDYHMLISAFDVLLLNRQKVGLYRCRHTAESIHDFTPQNLSPQ